MFPKQFQKSFFFFTEPFIEAVPQIMVLLCISFLSGVGRSRYEEGKKIVTFENCQEINCGIASIYFTGMEFGDSFFLITFISSVISGKIF